jgi:hypothetical protein
VEASAKAFLNAINKIAAGGDEGVGGEPGAASKEQKRSGMEVAASK